MVEKDITDQVNSRLKHLLNDQTIAQYKNHESFYSKENCCYQFLIWKLRPASWEAFSKEVQELVEQQGYVCIPGAWDISTYDLDKKTGYKVIALYKPAVK